MNPLLSGIFEGRASDKLSIVNCFYVLQMCNAFIDLKVESGSLELEGHLDII